MRAHEIAAHLEGFRGRGPGTDAERRAANWLARELAGAGLEVGVDPFWCRPNWALAHAWHVALVIAGSLLSVSDPGLGAALLLVALVSIVADAVLGASIGRRLTPERASQNVVARPARRGDQLRLVIAANYDAGRTGLVYRERCRAAAAWLRRVTGGPSPGWLGWLCIATVWLIAVAVLRHEHDRSTALAISQFIPTALLVLAGAALLELGTAGFGPAANDNGSGAAVAVALTRALAAAPPQHVAVELVLEGAGEGGHIGLRRHVRRRTGAPRPTRYGIRRRPRVLDRTNAAVIAFPACGAGRLRVWTSDGPLLPLRYSKRFRQLCATELDAAPHRGRGSTPALPARLAGIPAIALGCLDSDGIAPRSHQRGDVAAALEAPALDATLESALILVDALDTFLAHTASAHTDAPAPAGHAVGPATDP